MGGNLTQNLPDYGAVRMGADWASAIRGQTIFFNFDSGQLGVAPEYGPSVVSVYTAPSAQTRPTVNSATVAVEGYGQVTVLGNLCSALFWSESAVEKFLLPYYVSAGGPEALKVLHAINCAWYNYQGSTPVFALAFTYPSQGMLGPISLWDTVSVIYGETVGDCNHLVSVPLLYFIAGHRYEPTPIQAPTAGPSIPAPLSDRATPADSIEGREVAEYVSGLRGSIVYAYGNGIGGSLNPTLQPIEGLFPLFTAYCTPVRPERMQFQITVTLEVNGDSIPLKGVDPGAANDPDSVFWTDGAVDMLMLPYYASVKGHWAPWYLILLLGKWAGVIPLDLLEALELLKQLLDHPERLLRQFVDADAGTSSVYAIVHLPRSEYVDEGTPLDAFLLENRTVFLSTQAPPQPMVAPGQRFLPNLPVRG
jgi:hypothetical protein